MRISCPKCRASVPASRCNPATDVALCDRCNEVFAMSALVAAGEVPDSFDVDNPPSGAWFADTGTGWEVGATTRSLGALFLVPFMCVWSGFSLGGIYGSQIVNGQFNLLHSLFGIPFILGTLLFGSLAVMMVCGRVLVSVEDDAGRVFVGVGPVGWTRRFHWQTVTAVEEDWSATSGRGQHSKIIALIGPTRLCFGSLLTEPRRYYLLQALRLQLGNRGRHETGYRAGWPSAGG